ncbi:MAG TPA: hypothetical protein VJ201_04345, partial [Candidatus Babeliales bacterium]|nr:hypothetical protein [Candidatus Babeliales bacterium]
IDHAIEYFKENEEKSYSIITSELFRIDNTYSERLKNLEEYKSRLKYIETAKQNFIQVKEIPVSSD